MSKKELLVLFLIDKLPSLNNIYSLTRLYYRADFPANIDQVLKDLKSSKLIEFAENRTLNKMQVCKSSFKGRKVMKSDFNLVEILDYINTLDNPDFLYEITEKLMNKN